MKINLDDKLITELDSIFENERTSQTEWDVCIEDIVEEYIAKHTGTWEELPHEAEEEPDEIYIDLRGGSPSSNGVNGKHTHTITKPPFKHPSKNLQNRIDTDWK